MRLLREVASEIYSMFAGDAVMTIFAVAIVAVASALRYLTPVPPITIGFGLFAGCLLLLMARVFASAKNLRP